MFIFKEKHPNWETISKRFEEVYITLFSCGVLPPGMAPISTWQSVLDEAETEGRFIGVDKEAFPTDFASMTDYHDGKY